MQRFFTGRMDHEQCCGKPLPPIGEVGLGETFVVESTIYPEKREPLGPLFIHGVKPGDVVAIHVEDIRISKWWGVDPDYGMIPEILELQRVRDISFDVPLTDGQFVLPGNIRVPLKPMIGSISLAARERSPNAWDHGGNMDINEVRKGATLYIRAQREGGLLALGDLHAYQGDGEISGTAIEADGQVTLSLSVSDKFPVHKPVIEVDDRVMTVGMGLEYWDAVKSAVRDMTYLLMKVCGISLEAAYSTAVKAGSLRNGAIWMMSDHQLITMDSEDYRLPRIVFLQVPLERTSTNGTERS